MTLDPCLRCGGSALTDYRYGCEHVTRSDIRERLVAEGEPVHVWRSAALRECKTDAVMREACWWASDADRSVQHGYPLRSGAIALVLDELTERECVMVRFESARAVVAAMPEEERSNTPDRLWVRDPRERDMADGSGSLTVEQFSATLRKAYPPAALERLGIATHTIGGKPSEPHAVESCPNGHGARPTADCSLCGFRYATPEERREYEERNASGCDCVEAHEPDCRVGFA